MRPIVFNVLLGIIAAAFVIAFLLSLPKQLPPAEKQD
jgi:hypothetical protein